MYESHFGLSERPFSIAPDPQYLYMSQQHQEAMAHLQYGLTQGGGFILLTGEVGTGKTTLCRNLLTALPDNVDIALILNSKIQGDELLQTICDELKISYLQKDSHKVLLSKLNDFLLDSFANNRRTVLIIDEAQLLSRDVLEQIRMLTNLETTKTKLLQIILIGQPELNEALARQDLRQLAQRITARYHLKSIDKQDIAEYVTTRLKVAGCTRALFTKQALGKVYSLTKGIPRLINVLCDNSLLVAYSKGSDIVDAKIVKLASKEILNPVKTRKTNWLKSFFSHNKRLIIGSILGLGLFTVLWQFVPSLVEGLKSNFPQVALKAEVQDSQASEVSSTKATIDSELVGNLANAPIVEVEDDSQKQAQVRKEPSEKTPKLTLVEDLSTLLNSPELDTSRASAFRRLAKLWGHELPEIAIKPLCDSVRELTLDCFVGRASLEDLILYDRPASLLLNTEGGQHRVLLLSAGENDVSLDIGGDEYRVKKEQLNAVWDGMFLLYWQRPEIRNFLFNIGSTGARVVWLRQQINFALRKAGGDGLNNTTSTVYDEELANVVRKIQSDYNIDVDGQVGIKTIMAINTMIDSSLVPKLGSLKPESNQSTLATETENLL